MSQPNVDPLYVTADVIRQAVLHAREAKRDGAESCGLIFGSDTFGMTYVRMDNIAERPATNYAMRLAQVGQRYDEARKVGHDLVAVVHSHVASEPIPSENDKATPDHRPAYLIVSLADDAAPALRAWRMDLEFVGMPRASEVPIEISEPTPDPPDLPWALTPGNKVRLTYSRPGSVAPRTITTTIRAASIEDDVEGKRREAPRTSLALVPTRGTDPRAMLLERIRAVRVLSEHPDAARVAQRAAGAARALADALDNGRAVEVGPLVAYLTAAYPTWLRYGER